MDTGTLVVTVTVIDPIEFHNLCQFVQLSIEECKAMGMEKLQALAERVSWHINMNESK